MYLSNMLQFQVPATRKVSLVISFSQYYLPVPGFCRPRTAEPPLSSPVSPGEVHSVLSISSIPACRGIPQTLSPHCMHLKTIECIWMKLEIWMSKIHTKVWQIYFFYFTIIVIKTLLLLPKYALFQVWLKLSYWVYRKRFLKILNVFSEYLPGKGSGPSYEHHSKLLCSKFAWNLPSGFGE